ncbi:hypothetical protein HDU76_014088 [Blyttiomyces sp. JEL0837]|nr:hypothetical protein HDU76_014088 [Blyttiomyces sp. JEL0837]
MYLLTRSIMFTYLSVLSVRIDKDDGTYTLFYCYIVTTLILACSAAPLRLHHVNLLGQITVTAVLGGVGSHDIEVQKKRFFILWEVLCTFPSAHAVVDLGDNGRDGDDDNGSCDGGVGDVIKAVHLGDIN